MKQIIIGTRGSPLALWQAKHIQERLKNELDIDSALKIIKTKGDKILDVPLAKIGGKGLFTKELEEMLLSKEIDIAVHSLKDVPIQFISDLGLACITKREDPRDCFVSHIYPSLQSLPHKAKIGTTSLRRSMQLKAIRADFDTLSLRGNVQTRLKRLENGDFDAIILATAGLKRLDITESQIKYISPIPTTTMIPAMGQAALGIECKMDHTIAPILRKLQDELTALCVNAERKFVEILEGGCQAPIGVHCEHIEEGRIQISAMVGFADSSKTLKSSIQGNSQDSIALAIQLAHEMIANGAREILAEAIESYRLS